MGNRCTRWPSFASITTRLSYACAIMIAGALGSIANSLTTNTPLLAAHEGIPNCALINQEVVGGRCKSPKEVSCLDWFWQEIGGGIPPHYTCSESPMPFSCPPQVLQDMQINGYEYTGFGWHKLIP